MIAQPGLKTRRPGEVEAKVPLLGCSGSKRPWAWVNAKTGWLLDVGYVGWFGLVGLVIVVNITW